MSGAPKRRPFVVFGLAAVVVALLWWLWPQGSDESIQEAEQGAGQREDGRFQKVRGNGKKVPQVWEDRTASIAGTVTDLAGRPVTGAQVCAFTNTSDLPDVMTREPACTSTDDQGRYSIDELFAVDYTASASAPEFRPTRWRVDGDSRIRLRAGERREGIDIALLDGGVLVEGAVMDAAGGVIEGALVRSGNRWSGSGREGTAFDRTDENGHYTLWVEPGNVSVTASADGYNDGDRSGAAPGTDLDIHLVPESVLVGRVVMAGDGKPVQGVHVVAKASRWWGGRGGAAVTDGEGRFRIDRLEPGIYKPAATGEVGFGEADVSVHLGLSETSEEVEIVLHPAVTVRGTVVVANSSGEPCPDGYVRLQEKDLERWVRHDGVDPEGGVEIQGVLPGTYEVSVTCHGYVRRDRYDDVVVGGETIEGLVWEVDEGRVIRGRVVDESGDPVEDAGVRARAVGVERSETLSFGSSEDVGPDGSFEIRGLKAGTYEVTASPPRGFGLEAEAEVEVTPSADTEGLELKLPASGTIVGVVNDGSGQPVSGVQVRSEGPVRSWGRVYTGDDGRFELEQVPVGEHRVYATLDWRETLRKPGSSDDDIQGERAQVNAGEVVEVELTVEANHGSISGRVLDEDGGPVSDAFIQTQRESDSVTTGAGRSRRSVRGGGWNEQPILTDQDGSFAVDGLTEGARYTVMAHRKGGGEAVLEHVDEGATGVVLRLEPTGRIGGRVSMSSGDVPEVFDMSVTDEVQGVWRNERFFRTRGTFSLDRLPPGDYDVVATTPEGDASAEVKLAGGAEVLDVELELTSRVTVRGQLIDLETREPVAGMMVVLSSDKGPMMLRLDGSPAKENTSDDQGRFTVDRAPTGRARLFVVPRSLGSKADYGVLSSKVTIPDEDPYEMPPIALVRARIERDDRAGDLGFRLQETDAGEDRFEQPLVIGFVRPGGPAAKAGLEIGETIVAVDGHDVSGEHRSRYGALTRVSPGTKLTFEVEVESEERKRTVTLVAGKPV